jgi:multidrug efflux pump subunit AcrA (membrane-fusion protein)
MLVIIISCNQKTETPETSSKEDVKTPVTVTTISTEPLNDSVEINATSSFLQGNIVKSNINGYIKSVNTKPGQHAAAGQTLFIIKTKEAENLGNTINKLDPSFHFSGVVHITASQSGYLTFLNHQVGDYVQDGEQLAVISNSNSFGFMLNIPFELRKYVSLNKKVEVILPDGTHLNGTISSFMPTIDSIGQTQGALVKVPSSTAIPANLIAKVRILKTAKSNVPSLPKQAILTNEAQTSFWIMKMIDSVTAIKVSVIKGLETGNRVEIISPRLSPDDKILLNGNYGLPDTAKVQIIKGEQ